MNIKPVKPSGKTEPVKKKKSKKAETIKGELFSRMVAESLEEAGEVEELKEEELSDLKSLHQQFVASVNHEINNPLFVVRGMTELIKEKSLAGLKNRILKDADSISREIRNFNHRDMKALGDECKKAPFTEIAFRKDLVGCYLYKVIGPLTASIGKALDDIENVLNIEKGAGAPQTQEYDKVKKAFQTIRRHAERIRQIIKRLEELLPDDIKETKYIEELKMVRLK